MIVIHDFHWFDRRREGEESEQWKFCQMERHKWVNVIIVIVIANLIVCIVLILIVTLLVISILLIVSIVVMTVISIGQIFMPFVLHKVIICFLAGSVKTPDGRLEPQNQVFSYTRVISFQK